MVLIDNDIVLKSCCYAVGVEMANCLSVNGIPPAILKVAAFVVRGRMKKFMHLADRAGAEQRLNVLLGLLDFVEPNAREVELAAGYEAAAQASNLPLDAGESQLLAILVSRGLTLMVTGDKRAIVAVESMLGAEFTEPKLACLEQTIVTILQHMDSAEMRSRICSEPKADSTLSICFACSSDEPTPSSICEALRSYINEIRVQAPHVIVQADNLLGFVA